jgi:flagellar protein FlaG
MSAITPSDASKPSLIIDSKIEVSSANQKAPEVNAKETSSAIEKLFSTKMKSPTEPPISTTETVRSLQPGSQATKESPSRHLLNAAVSEMNDFVQSIQRELHFTVDEDSGRTVVKVIDKSTNEVVRQVPPEDLMAMLKEFSKPAQPGLIFKDSA